MIARDRLIENERAAATAQQQRAEAEIARLRQELAEEKHAAATLLAANDKLIGQRDTLRRQLAEVDQYGDDCWRAGAAGMPVQRWNQWAAERTRR